MRPNYLSKHEPADEQKRAGVLFIAYRWHQRPLLFVALLLITSVPQTKKKKTDWLDAESKIRFLL